ncbi:MAG TPA: hypothetical protein VGO11_19010 [Chthoniobacteraceae bacterium]|jgi:hypothetical protein|nr:hypothetical protein [Chthoniobacteraceae bacterium]
MTLHVNLPDSLAAQACEMAAREQISVDALIASALTVKLDRIEHRPTIAERAARADFAKFDAILARVLAVPPVPGDE